MPLEAKRFRHVAVAIPELRVSRSVAVSPASRARSRSSQMSRITRPSSAGTVANRSIAAWASATSPSAPRSSSVSTRTPVAWCPTSAAVPAEQMVDGGRMTGWPHRGHHAEPSHAPRICRRSVPDQAISARAATFHGPPPAAPVRAHALPPCRGAPERRPGSFGRWPVRYHRRIPRRSAAPPRSRAPRVVGPQHPNPIPAKYVTDDRGVGHGVAASGHRQGVPRSSRHPGRPRQYRAHSPRRQRARQRRSHGEVAFGGIAVGQVDHGLRPPQCVSDSPV